MSFFYSRLSYSFGNEDWKTESKALNIQPGDRAVCITASGDRPLHLLLDDCAELVSVDLNPIQNHLLNLKVAAMSNLEYEDYLSFLGGSKDQIDRKDILAQLCKNMCADSANFWMKNHKMVQKGVLYQGTVEKFLKVIAYCFKVIRGKKVERLFNFDCLEEQKKFVSEEWDVYLWRKLFEIILHPKISRYLIKDPGLQDNLVSGIKPGTYIYDRITNSLRTYLAKENLLLSMLYTGKVQPSAFPPYLQKESVQKIRDRLPRLQNVTTNIVNFLESEPVNKYNCFSLSDVVSYVNENEFERLMHAVYRTAKPGARFSMRQFLSNRSIPETLQKAFCRNTSLEKELDVEDRCFVYRFTVGHIEK